MPHGTSSPVVSTAGTPSTGGRTTVGLAVGDPDGDADVADGVAEADVGDVAEGVEAAVGRWCARACGDHQRGEGEAEGQA